MSDHSTTLRNLATWLRGGHLADDIGFDSPAESCEAGAAALERDAERQRSECSRPHFAPENAAALRRKAAHGGTPSYLRDAIRAALAALGESPHE